MKKYTQFVNEANQSLAVLNAKRLGLVSDGKGGWYKDGEFVAKTVGGNLQFYNQKQIIGGKDPKQIHPQSSLAQRKVASLTKASNVSSSPLTNNQIREKYIKGEIFNEGDFVSRISDGKVGKIIRRGSNHLICVTEKDEMFKSWIHDLNEWTNQSGVPADKREIGTDAIVQYAMRMTHTKKIRNFINRYRKSTTN
jgi:hypothetical protein